MARHYGIPYMGSKQKLVDKLIPFILKRHPETTDFYDPFGGGASASLYCVRKYSDMNVHYNELSTAIGGLLKHLQDDGELSFDWIPREKFNELKNGSGWQAGLMQTVWSFGNKTDATYLYGKSIQDFKYELHKLVVDGERNLGIIEQMAEEILKRDYGKELKVKLFLDQERYKTIYQRRILMNRQIPYIGAMQHLGRLERLRQIQKMAGFDRLKIEMGKSYDEVKFDGKHPIIYCDPPYEGTAEYAEGGFNSAAFYDWMAAQPYPVYLSSYKISDPRFKLVKAIKTRSLLDQKTRDSYHFNYENLYWNGLG